MNGGDLSVAVVGGGIGGLAAALSLLRAGFDVQVFERASALMEVGAGIQISPNASRLLHRLGLAAALDQTGVRSEAVHQRRWHDGRTLQRAPLGEAGEAAIGAPYYHFHRADVLKAPADALAAFKGWHPKVGAIIGAVDETFIWALFDRAPLDRWSVGRVTRLGDACHAMLPFMAQGAAQSIEDGATLAACLLQDSAADVPSALRRYEALRRPRATRLQEMARANKTRFHLSDGPEQQARDTLLATRGDRTIEALG